MRRTFTTIFAAVGLIFAFHAAAAAQIGARYKGFVPFDFSVNGDNYHAGEYIIGPLFSLSNQGAVVLLSKDTNRAEIIGLGGFGNDLEPTARIRFAHTDGRYYMASIETPTIRLKMQRTWTDIREVAGGETKYTEIMLALK